MHLLRKWVLMLSSTSFLLSEDILVDCLRDGMSISLGPFTTRIILQA